LFKKLGISVDWSLSYSTIAPLAQRIAQRSFLDLIEKGLVERKKGPVIWCPQCGTALAQSDLEDAEKQSSLHTIIFSKGMDGEDDLLIATTRPEFLPACVAIFVHSQDVRYTKLIGREITVPLYGQKVPIIADDKVDPSYGTGAMMVCTWGDGEDVCRWMAYNLSTREIITRTGTIDSSIPEIGGLSTEKARAVVVNKLKEEGLLINSKPLTHTLKVHERCGTPNEYVMATQWFIKIADSAETWKKRGAELNWFPSTMKSRYDSWIDGLKWDWCISRQRYYGVPFPVWYCDDCGKILLAQLSNLPVDPSSQTYTGGTCPACQSSHITPEGDVMDTWMTSSLTPLINANWQEEGEESLMKRIYPMSLRVQAFEIIRTWLFYTVVKSHFHTDSLPWKSAMISGWGLDQNGKKISKSSGTSANAEDLINRFSADAVRFWASDSELGSNRRFSEEELKKGNRLVTKLVNAARLAQMHMTNYQVRKPVNCTLHASDRWILSCLKKTIIEYDRHFSSFEYSKARKVLDSLFWGDFCDNYLEFIKPRLCSSDDNEPRQAALETLYYCLLAIVKMYAPFVPFVTEEIYQQLFAATDGAQSIHITSLPTIDGLLEGENDDSFDLVLEIVGMIRKYRSSKSMSFRALIDSMTIETKKGDVDLEFISKVMNVRSVVAGISETEPFWSTPECRLWIS
jgi:valyl-tRNA synthetase